MAIADRGRTAEPLEQQDAASGVHVSKEPTNETGWRTLLAPEGGELEAPVEALLNAYLRLKRRHEQLVRNAEALSSALERVPLGLAVLVNRHLVVANREAYRLIDGSGLRRTVEDEIVARDPEIQQELLSAITKIEGGSERAALVVPRQGGSLQVVLTQGGPSLPHAIVVALADPETPPTTDADGYRKLYGLTPTEAKVAVQLVLGRSPREIAEHLGVGVETTRTHVKHILHKMGCHRQVDVVRRLVTGPTSLR